MNGLTDSRLAVYEGIIALAWADHELTNDERDVLRAFIDGNSSISPEQRSRLVASIDNEVALKDIWPRITEKEDRVFLLNLADTVFHADGNYCESEKELYEQFLAKHLDELNNEAELREVSGLAMEKTIDREKFKLEMEEYTKQRSLAYRIKSISEKMWK